ncbi:glycoside hydrolase family 3 N-terminal domain-containing protein [Pseudonocardia sp. GCM10023141]|uniref:glycoside hydrolase family 3 N-terminal domain-containing protein n=1 Tax=Pseudonocardia sp. GCM10023141 TaxID=3252653 RepID=UPI00360EFCC4
MPTCHPSLQLRAHPPQRRRGTRPAGPLLVGMLAGLVAAMVAGLAVPAPALALTPMALAPQADTSGSALGPDRLPACSAVVAAMTPRARVAQRLMVGVDASDPAGTAESVRATQIGGIFIGGDATDLLQNQALRGVQAVSRIPLAVAVDDEGGRVQRVDALDGNLPSARTMAAQQTPVQVQEAAQARGKALAARGITMNFGPVVDVGQQPSGAVIGDRSFSSDPKVAAQYAAAFAMGERTAGIFTVLKHFPGHGRGDGDSHKGRVTTPPLAELKSDDLLPYTALLGAGGPLSLIEGKGRTGVMVGHLDVPGLTDDLPSSLTPATYKLLREDYKFDGFVITDDLGAMKAVTGTFELPEAVERALAAGADMALWSAGGRITPVLDRLEQALTAGRLDAAADDTAVARVLRAKSVCS